MRVWSGKQRRIAERDELARILRQVQMRDIDHGARDDLFFGAKQKNQCQVESKHETEHEQELPAAPAFAGRFWSAGPVCDR